MMEDSGSPSRGIPQEDIFAGKSIIHTVAIVTTELNKKVLGREATFGTTHLWPVRMKQGWDGLGMTAAVIPSDQCARDYNVTCVAIVSDLRARCCHERHSRPSDIHVFTEAED